MKWNTSKPCVSCKSHFQACYHHIKTRGAYPQYQHEAWNKMPLCQRCHNYVHSQGLNELAKNPRVTQWLFDHDWEFDSFLAKWVNKNQYAQVDDDF